jgi:PAS domain S-box-containing protein
VDTPGRFLEVNTAYCQMSGYSTPELLAMRVADLEAAEDTAAHIQQVLAQGKDRFESRHRRKDGTLFDAEVGVQYRPIDGGRLVAFLRGITARKHAEVALAAHVVQVKAVRGIAAELARELHLDAILPRILWHALALTGATVGTVYL